MKKRITGRAQRRKIQRDLNKGKLEDKSHNINILYKLKYVLNQEQSTKLVKSFDKIKYQEIRGNLLPKGYSEIRKKGCYFAINDLEKEIIWYTNEICEFHYEINRFLEYENDFECNFLIGNYSEASRIIDDIERFICTSQWSIEKKLLIAEYKSGFKKNKEVLTSILDKENDSLTNFLSKYQSVRIEQNLSYFKYEEIIQSLMKAQSDLKFKEFINFKLNFFYDYQYLNKGFILNVENSSSIIDKYESFITIIILILSEKKKDDSTILVIKNCLNKLINKINDIRIVNALYDTGETPKFVIDTKSEDILKIIDLYSIGKYSLVIEYLNNFLLKNSNIFELYELYVKSIINSNRQFLNIFDTNSFAGQCIEDLYNIFCKNDKTQFSLVNIHKYYSTLGNTKWSYKLFSFFHNEHSTNFDTLDIQKYSNLNCNFFNPTISVYLLNSNTYNDYLLNISISKNNITSSFYQQICQILNESPLDKFTVQVDSFRSDLYYAQILNASGKFGLALEAFDSIYLNHQNIVLFQHNKLEVLYGKFLSLISLNKFKEAVILIAELNIENPNFNQKLRSDFFLKKIIDSDDKILMSEISTVIVLYQYQAFINPNDIWIAYDNFLSSYSLDYPKEIETILDILPKEKIIFFLKYICKQEVFASSYLFENQDELDNERIDICLLLTRLDKENFEEYINEISVINRNILIRKGIKQMDESKIYVDVAGIKNILKKDIKESFDRSMNLLNLSLGEIEKLDLERDNIIVPYYGKSPDTNKIEFRESNIKITSYSRYKQFLEMFYKIRDKFIASNEFGIDSYLSMRIRHGTLSGEIRSVFESNYLITKKEDSSDKYKDNIYWKKINLKSDSILNTKFDLILSDFSKNIDNISNELKNKKLQIRTEKKESDGFFDYSFENDTVLSEIFSRYIGGLDDYDEFFDEIINILWERTEYNLMRIRDDISENVKSEMVLLLVNLSKDIESLVNKNDFPEVNELIRNITICQTDIKNELDKIAAWFKRTNSKTINEFNIQLPIDSTLITLKRLYKDFNNFSPELNIDCNIKFEGENFPHFCYIFQNLLHNIIGHSKLECDLLKVKITIVEKSNDLIITVENNFSESISIEALNQKIEVIRQSLSQTHDNDKIRAEEGTGYLKIKKTLKSDLSREIFQINIYTVNEDRNFKTKIKFNLNHLQKKYNEISID